MNSNYRQRALNQAMGNNPALQNMAQAYQAMKTGNPAAVFQQFAGQTPQGQAILQAMNNGQSVSAILDVKLKEAGMTKEQAIAELKKTGLL